MSNKKRSCGTCTACCTIMGVPELDKGAHQACCHQGRAKCNLYAARPQSCRDFECLWLQGYGGQEHRPDQSGIMLTVTTKDGVLGKAGAVIVAHEVSPGASDRMPGKPLVEAFIPAVEAVIIARANGTRAVLSKNPVVLRRAEKLVRSST